MFMLLVALIMVLNYNSQVQIQETGNDINTLYTPSIILLEEINRSMAKSDAHMEHVTFFQTKEDAPERVELIYILESGLPEKLSRLDSISKKCLLLPKKSKLNL